ncbi:RidA family protein [Roseovarius sp. A21]|uniref:RidA family protein n=1 Tax=Roseovarius bejariae TaxID=2576383 RepID=A0A844CMX7_9RHOB|nr:RidA family protein [Roseovarius bejariae]MRU14825.1 RidA family protein [Roseovarius bejariae]
MTEVTRAHVGQRMSQIVTHGDTIYLAGQVGNPGDSVADQTKTCIERVETLLAEAGSDATRILQCVIWMADMADFAEMNAVWDAWVPEGHAPARACGEAKLATPEYKVEFIVIAAKG